MCTLALKTLRSLRDALACSYMELTWRHSCRLLVTRGTLCPPLSNYKVESQPCVVLQREGGQGSFILCVQFHSCSGQVSVALHVSVSHSWCSRVRKGRKGSLQNRKLTTLLSIMPSVSLRFQQSSHTKHRISCFGLGGAHDKSTVTCSLQRPQGLQPSHLVQGVSGKASCLTLEDVA